MGALAGDWIAQHIAARDVRRAALINEVRDTNAAVNVAYTIFNAIYSVKRQHIERLKHEYDSSRIAHKQHRHRIEIGEIAATTPFDLKADLQTLTLQKMPT